VVPLPRAEEDPEVSSECLRATGVTPGAPPGDRTCRFGAVKLLGSDRGWAGDVGRHAGMTAKRGSRARRCLPAPDGGPHASVRGAGPAREPRASVVSTRVPGRPGPRYPVWRTRRSAPPCTPHLRARRVGCVSTTCEAGVPRDVVITSGRRRGRPPGPRSELPRRVNCECAGPRNNHAHGGLPSPRPGVVVAVAAASHRLVPGQDVRLPAWKRGVSARAPRHAAAPFLPR